MKKAKRLRRIDPAFSRAFTDCCRLLELAPELFAPNPRSKETSVKSRSARTVHLIRELQNRITPGAKAAAIKRNRKLSDLALQLLREHGSPSNKAQFIRELKEVGALDGILADRRPYTLDDRTVSRFLRDRFGIVGKPGRKPR